MLALVAAPFVGLFPEPPAFGRGAVGIAAAVLVLATVGAAFRASIMRRKRIVGWAAILLAVTTASLAVRIAVARTVAADLPTLDILATILGLKGEDIDDAVLYEGWLEAWLGCGLVAAAAAWGWGAAARTRPPLLRSPRDVVAPPAEAGPPWNAATLLLWLVGWAVLAVAVVEGHRTADFLGRAIHVTGVIADSQAHPRIRFTTADGNVVEYTQNGSVSRPLGANVPVAYLAVDPAGSAQADTFWADWSDLLGLLWVGLGFTLFPFYGLRATFRPGRW